MLVGNMNRHYARCMYCERPISFECEKTNVEFILNQNCPLCGEKELRYMGEVHKTDIVREGVRAACDARCTNAVGPQCNCLCVNANHGTHRLVVFNKVVGKLEVVNKEILNDNPQYLARIKRMAAAKVEIKRNILAFLDWKYKDVLLRHGDSDIYLTYKDWDDLGRYGQFKKTIEKIEDLRSIQKKINKLTHMIPQIGNNLDYIEAVALAKGLVK